MYVFNVRYTSTDITWLPVSRCKCAYMITLTLDGTLTLMTLTLDGPLTLVTLPLDCTLTLLWR